MTAQHGPDNWQRGNVYDGYVGRWSRKVAPEFLAWVDAPAGRRWLDVAGPGRCAAPSSNTPGRRR